ncbi:methylenetetrahydrofolate reductase [Iamia majanohamensis]|uniref:Methylenetetrahydrofolate reductase n=1 Tax=Iamia majanohamensis TaxID=467976 RepID=A0AAE9YAA6_9ACTN|nr:methylenetetrahydrofolate reductase [Iamia majanohamensis]WCO67458.1 methylenetetrahydrofolate reductase [Iamia majanohamensis]
MARIDDLLASGRTVSFEFPPPKTPEALVTFDETMEDLAQLGPQFISVTYGALGTTRDTTRDVVIRVDKERDFPAMPHLTCVGHTRAELEELVTHYRDAGIENILALAGDPPADGSEAGGDFTYATELIELVREVGDFSVGVAAFPEMHPRSPHRDDDLRFLAAKLAQADFAITQFFWDPADYVSMVEDLSARGCDKPIVPGVMPFTSVAGVRRMSGMNGSAIPASLEARLDRVDGDKEATRALGVEVASEVGAALLEAGVPGMHLYTMNRAASVRQVCANLGLLRDAGPPSD